MTDQLLLLTLQLLHLLPMLSDNVLQLNNPVLEQLLFRLHEFGLFLFALDDSLYLVIELSLQLADPSLVRALHLTDNVLIHADL